MIGSLSTTSVVVSVGGYVLLGAMGAWLTKLGPWYYGLRKPSWQPPDWLFGPAWTTIFACAAAAAMIGWNAPTATAGQRTALVIAFVANGLGNMLWSYLFFARRRPDWAFVEVLPFWATIVAMIVVVWPLSATAALLCVPYLLWVGFASFLNWTVVQLNRPFGGV